jgi:hypothetical protein
MLGKVINFQNSIYSSRYFIPKNVGGREFKEPPDPDWVKMTIINTYEATCVENLLGFIITLLQGKLLAWTLETIINFMLAF